MKLRLASLQTIRTLSFGAFLVLTCHLSFAVDGEKLFKAQCVACHGATGAGNAALQAPPLAGTDRDYIARQLRNFRSHVRGGDAPQGGAATMQAIAASIPNEDAVSALAQYIGTLKPAPARTSPTPLGSSLNAGKALFSVCLACHGNRGEGTPALGAPRLAHLPPWYLTEQLQAFRDGRRGAHPDDKPGREMYQVVRELELDDAAIGVLGAYIGTLGVKSH